MAAGTLPQPGTELGPCASPCAHRDCQATRNMAAGLCRFCHQPIGYDRRFYQENAPAHPATYVHADCLEADVEARLEAERKQP